MYRSLGEFVAALEWAGELVRIRERVSPVLEIAAIADRVSKQKAPGLPSAGARRTDPRFCDRGGPALLFEQVEGSDFPVLINGYGSYRRVEMAMGRRAGGEGLERIAAKIGNMVKPEPPRSLREAFAKVRELAPLARIGPRRKRGRGPCQEVTIEGDAVDLTKLPLIRCWPLDGDLAAVGYPADVNAGVPGLGHPAIDGPSWERDWRGRYITFGGIHTIHADDAGAARPRSHNIGMYRVQLFGKRTMAMHWHVHHDGASHWRSWKRAGKPMPVAIALGGESVLPYAATCPLPPGISELLMAGFLHGRGIEMVRGVSVPLWVPANAEIVIEGYVSHEAGEIGWDPRVPRDQAVAGYPAPGPLGPGAVFEGPFGDHTGFYSMPDRYPILTVTAITHRRGAVYPTTIVGLPPQEDYYLGKATERIMLPLLKTMIHDVEDYDLPQFGAFHNCAMVRIRKSYPLHARRVMHAVWGAGQMSWTKCIFVVDDDVDVHDAFAVLRAASAWCRPDRDVERVRGPLDILDHAAPRLGAGTKIGLDCTRKVPGEEVGGLDVSGQWSPPDAAAREAVVRAVKALPGVANASWPAECGGWLFVACRKENAGDGRRLVEAVLTLASRDNQPGCAVPPFVVVVGSHVDVGNPDEALFHWVANFDAGRDAIWGDGRVGFDATPKIAGDEANGEPVRDWPPVIETSPHVRDKVAGIGPQ